MATPPKLLAKILVVLFLMNLVHFLGSADLVDFGLVRIICSRVFPSFVILKYELFCRILVDSSFPGPEMRYFVAN